MQVPSNQVTHAVQISNPSPNSATQKRTRGSLFFGGGFNPLREREKILTLSNQIEIIQKLKCTCTCICMLEIYEAVPLPDRRCPSTRGCYWCPKQRGCEHCFVTCWPLWRSGFGWCDSFSVRSGEHPFVYTMGGGLEKLAGWHHLMINSSITKFHVLRNDSLLPLHQIALPPFFFGWVKQLLTTRSAYICYFHIYKKSPNWVQV